MSQLEKARSLIWCLDRGVWLPKQVPASALLAFAAQHGDASGGTPNMGVAFMNTHIRS